MTHALGVTHVDFPLPLAGPATVPWRYLAAADHDISFLTATGALLADGAHGTAFAIAPEGDTAPNTGTLTLLAAAPAGATLLRLRRRTPPTQPFEAPVNLLGAEAALDRLAMSAEENRATLSRTLRTDATPIGPFRPAAANTLLFWNGSDIVSGADPLTVEDLDLAAAVHATGQDRIATAADRVQTGLDRTATAADRVQTGLDRTATAADRVQTGLDRAATAASAAAAAVAQVGAETARDVTLLSKANFASTAAALSMGVIGIAGLVPGTGGTNGQFDLAITGGGGVNAKGRFVVAGGAVTSVTITSPGTGYTSAPSISFGASTGSTASATAVIGNRVEEGEFFSVPVAGDPMSLILYQVTAGRIATEITRYPAASIITAEATDNRVPRAPVGRTDLRAAWTPRGMIGLPAVLAENPMLAQFDLVADFTRGTYLRDGALMNYDQMFVPRRAEPLTRDGLLIPDASEKNRAYVGLNDKTFEGFNKTTQFASLTKEILELDALAPDERAWFLAQPLPFERVFSFVNGTGSTASAQALTMGGTTGTVTASGYLWNRAGNSQLSNGVQHTSAAAAPSGARLTATGTATTVQARLPAGAACLIGGMMLELGGSVTDYEDSLPVRNRLELRDNSIIDPAAGGTVLMRVKWPTALLTGSDEIFGLCKTDPITGERDRTTVLRVIINWESLGAININPDDGNPASINLQPTWHPDLPILIAFSRTPDGTIRLCTNAGEMLTNATGKDLSGMNQMQIGGAFPQGTTAPFGGKFLRGNLEAFAYRKGAY